MFCLTLDLRGRRAAQRDPLYLCSLRPPPMATAAPGSATTRALPPWLRRAVNAYGRSKHLADRPAAEDVVLRTAQPPQWARPRFFNVYGTNEADKGYMESIVGKIHPIIEGGGTVHPLQSHKPSHRDGGNCGISSCKGLRRGGRPRHCRTEGHAVCSMSVPAPRGASSTSSMPSARRSDVRRRPDVSTPADFGDQYQYFTQADISNCALPFSTSRSTLWRMPRLC